MDLRYSTENPEGFPKFGRPFDYFRVYTSGETFFKLDILKRNTSIFYCGLYHEICSYLFGSGLYSLNISSDEGVKSSLKSLAKYCNLSPKKLLKSIVILVEYGLFDVYAFEAFGILQSEAISNIYSILSKRRNEYYLKKQSNSGAPVGAPDKEDVIQVRQYVPAKDRLAAYGVGKNNIEAILSKRTDHYVNEAIDSCMEKIISGNIKNPAGYIVAALLHEKDGKI